MLGIVIAMLAGGLIGLLVGIYLVAEKICTTKTGCLACGRPWGTIDGAGLPRTPNVRVIPRAQNELPLTEGDSDE